MKQPPIRAHSRSSWQQHADRRSCGEAAVPRTRAAFATGGAPTGRRSSASVAQSRTVIGGSEASRRRHRKDGRTNLVSGKHRKHRRYSRSGPIGPPSFVSAQEHMRLPIGPLGHVARRQSHSVLSERGEPGCVAAGLSNND